MAPGHGEGRADGRLAIVAVTAMAAPTAVPRLSGNAGTVRRPDREGGRCRFGELARSRQPAYPLSTYWAAISTEGSRLGELAHSELSYACRSPG